MPLFDLDNNPNPPEVRAAVIPVSKQAATTPVVLLEANPNRVGATLYNRSSATLYIDFAEAPSQTDFMLAIPPGAYWEMPYVTGQELRGVWRASNGKALIRDFVISE